MAGREEPDRSGLRVRDTTVTTDEDDMEAVREWRDFLDNGALDELEVAVGRAAMDADIVGMPDARSCSTTEQCGAQDPFGQGLMKGVH